MSQNEIDVILAALDKQEDKLQKMLDKQHTENREDHKQMFERINALETNTVSKKTCEQCKRETKEGQGWPKGMALFLGFMGTIFGVMLAALITLLSTK